MGRPIWTGFGMKLGKEKREGKSKRGNDRVGIEGK